MTFSLLPILQPGEQDLPDKHVMGQVIGHQFTNETLRVAGLMYEPRVLQSGVSDKVGILTTIVSPVNQLPLSHSYAMQPWSGSEPGRKADSTQSKS